MGQLDVDFLSPERIGFVLVVHLWSHGFIFKDGKHAATFFAEALSHPDCLSLDELLGLCDDDTKREIEYQWSQVQKGVNTLSQRMQAGYYVGQPSLREKYNIVRPFSKKTVLGKLLLQVEGCFQRLEMDELVGVFSAFCRAAAKVGVDPPRDTTGMAELFGSALEALEFTPVHEEQPKPGQLDQLHRKIDKSEQGYAQGLLEMAKLHSKHGFFSGATDAALEAIVMSRADFAEDAQQEDTATFAEILGLLLCMYNDNNVQIPTTIGTIPQILKFLKDHPESDAAVHVASVHNALVPGADPAAALAAMDAGKSPVFDAATYHLVHIEVWIRFGRGLLANAHLAALMSMKNTRAKSQIAVVLGTWFDQTDKALEFLDDHEFNLWRVLFQAAQKLKAFQPLAASEILRSAVDPTMPHLDMSQLFYYRTLELDILLQQRRHASVRSLALEYADSERDGYRQLSYEIQACRALLMRGSNAMEAESTATDIVLRAESARFLPLVVEANIVLAHSLILQGQTDVAANKLEQVLGLASMCQIPKLVTEAAVVYGSIAKADKFEDVVHLATSNPHILAEEDGGSSRVALAVESLRRIYGRDDDVRSFRDWSFDDFDDSGSVVSEELLPLHVEVSRLALVAPPVEGRKRRNSKDMRSPHKRR